MGRAQSCRSSFVQLSLQRLSRTLCCPINREFSLQVFGLNEGRRARKGPGLSPVFATPGGNEIYRGKDVTSERVELERVAHGHTATSSKLEASCYWREVGSLSTNASTKPTTTPLKCTPMAICGVK
jgi:hypothetical protein